MAAARASGEHRPPHNDTHEDEDERTYICTGPAPRPRPRSHTAHSKSKSNPTMLISHNLVAALEYDEQAKARASLEGPSPRSPSLRSQLFAEGGGPAAATGLPPPPRPKSSASLRRPQTRSPPTSPAASLMRMARVDPPPPASPRPKYEHEHEHAPQPQPKANPYVNPPPRLAHLRTGTGGGAPGLALARTHSRTPSLPDRLATRSPESVRTGEGSPRGSAASSPVLVSSPESASARAESIKSAGGEGRTGFQRHMRVWSALPERILAKGKGKARAGGTKSVDEKRRASDAGGEAGPGKEAAGPMMRQFFKSLERHRAGGGGGGDSDGSRSAPVSPVMRTARGGGKTKKDAGEMETENEPVTTERRRPSAARQSWSRSSASLSESSHEPPPTPDEPRISISSTVYQASHSSIHYSPLYNTDAPLFPAPDMHSDTESFMDLASPTFSPQLTDFASRAPYPPRSSSQPYPKASPDTSPKPALPAITTAGISKPPLPTTPKPHFNRRSKSAQPHLNKAPGDSPVGQEVSYPVQLPPTTNFLNPQERAGRVRTARKLAQLLGQTPPAAESLALSQQAYAANAPGGFLSASNGLFAGKKKAPGQHQRGAVSMSVTAVEHAVEHEPHGRAATAPTSSAILAARRHSSPLSPQTFSFVTEASEAASEAATASNDDVDSVIEIGSQQGEPYSDGSSRDWSSHGAWASAEGLMSPTSFMDLSEEDIAPAETPKVDRPHLLSSGASIYSFTSEELVEEDRRRKREKLAKLHRFLGSRVPVDIVLNQLSLDVQHGLPPIAQAAPVSALDQPTAPTMDNDARKVWLRRRRSSSAAELGGKWSDDIDRLKEELNEREKAQNVRRAVKMEKLFGVQPPQTLYHTRSAPSHAEAQLAAVARQAAPPSPVGLGPPPRNVNQTAYSRAKAKKGHRPGTAESSKPLLDPSNSGNSGGGGYGYGFSDVYEHYRHSLNSLNDIMDRDDTASLKRLHSIIRGEGEGGGGEPALQEFVREEEDAPTPTYEPAPDADAGPSDAPTTPRLRRRSLPSRASMTSISSEFSIASVASVVPSAEEVAFQARRRRAAKLTQFFGVHYRDLMGEILERLEKGLEEEGGRGTLRPDEVQELLTKLRKLKIKRNSSFTLTNPTST